MHILVSGASEGFDPSFVPEREAGRIYGSSVLPG